LIVDTHLESLAMYAFGLLAMGFQPVTAGNVDEAFARACDVHPDAVVADITAPAASGRALTRRLRGDSRTRDAGIIVLTGVDEGYAGDPWCDRVLLKPCLPDALAFEIHDLLSSRRQASRKHSEREDGRLADDGDTPPAGHF
jgi:DNA-binding response OmpR family regulator